MLRRGPSHPGFDSDGRQETVGLSGGEENASARDRKEIRNAHR